MGLGDKLFFALINTALLRPSIQRFIQENENEDEAKLRLKRNLIEGVASAQIAEQIRGRRKARVKLPSYYQKAGIIYPHSINLEQCSSEMTAQFKASFLSEVVKPVSVADLTGGFGVDTFFLSRISKRVHYVEPDQQLLEIAEHNHLSLGASNIQYHQLAAEEFLANTVNQFDLIYLDPSRRNKSERKVFRLSDCEPDVIRLLPMMFRRSPLLLLKASPLLDLMQGLKELRHVKKIVVLSVENECKELLFLCRQSSQVEPLIEAINLDAQGKPEAFAFSLSEEKNATVSFSDPLSYLCEPNSSILKSGAFKLIGQRFGLDKIHPNTHLYTSEKVVPDFPGRIFRIEVLVKPEPKKLLDYFPEGKANVLTRNYPLTPNQLKKKTGLKDGGDKFLIGFSGREGKFLAVAHQNK